METVGEGRSYRNMKWGEGRAEQSRGGDGEWERGGEGGGEPDWLSGWLVGCVCG